MPRMRTIAGAYEDLKKADPACSLTQTALRRLVIAGELPCIRIGSKYLLDLDILEEYLSSGSTKLSQTQQQLGVVRKIQEL